jgi:hypothetical protein
MIASKNRTATSTTFQEFKYALIDDAILADHITEVIDAPCKSAKAVALTAPNDNVRCPKPGWNLDFFIRNWPQFHGGTIRCQIFGFPTEFEAEVRVIVYPLFNKSARNRSTSYNADCAGGENLGNIRSKPCCAHGKTTLTDSTPDSTSFL